MNNKTAILAFSVLLGLATSAEAALTDSFLDDFNTINKDNWYVTRVNYNWSYSGLDYGAISISDGSLRLYNDITDNGPVVFGKPIKLSQGNLSITRNLFIHPQNDHFDGSLDVYESDNSFSSSTGKHLCSVYYARESYGTSRIGFFLNGNDLLSSPLSPIWDAWFNEEFKYDAKTGVAKYTANGQTITHQCASSTSDYIKVRMHSYGWWTGHYTDIDSISINVGGVIPSDLDMTQANCRYVAPIYNKMWQQMKVKKAPSCGAVLRYHTWVNSTRPENYTAGNYYSDRLANIDTSNQLLKARLKLIDDGISILSDVLDPDLRKAFTPEGYQSTVNIMKTKGIVKSLAAGKTPFKLNTLKGKILNKAFKDKIIGEGISGGSSEWLCHQFLDGAVAESCSNEAKKVATCGVGLATEGWKGAAGCVIGGVTTFTGFINSVFDIGQIVSIKQHNYGYVLINDYLNDYYAKGSTVTALDEVKLEADIQKYADQLSLSSGGLFTFADFDMQFVKDGIRDSILRNLVKANANIRTVEQIKAILNK